MKKKKQLSRKAYNILSWINAILLIVTILMFLAGLGGEGYWVHFGVTAGVYVVWAFVFSRFDLNEEDKKKDELKKQEKKALNDIRRCSEKANITNTELKSEKERIKEKDLFFAVKRILINLLMN